MEDYDADMQKSRYLVYYWLRTGIYAALAAVSGYYAVAANDWRWWIPAACFLALTLNRVVAFVRFVFLRQEK